MQAVLIREGRIQHAQQHARFTLDRGCHHRPYRHCCRRRPRQRRRHRKPRTPLFATTKVEGTDNVYVFRYQNHQAMFVVTPAGVIATDPISYGRPQAAETYLAEIKQDHGQAPIKYLIYSHHHYDHIAGGKLVQGGRRRRDRAPSAPRSGWRR